MRLLSLAVRDFRGIDERRVELLGTGVTILEGPNEAGKTSLAEALEMLFERLDSSTAAEVKEAQPLGRDVGPEVAVEAEAGEVRFRYRKRFLKRPETVLEVLAPAAESLTGREAHERVAELLTEAGVDRDLWKALRVVQGGGVAQPHDLAASPSLLDALGAASAADETAAEAGGRHPVDLHQAVTAECRRYFTEKRREPSGELRQAREELAAAETTVAELEGQMAALDADAERAGELERRQVELRGAVEAAAAAAAAARGEVARVEGLEARVSALRADLADERDTLELLQELQAAEGAVADLMRRKAAAEAAEAEAREALAPVELAARQADASLAAARERLDLAREREQRVERLAARRQALAELDERSERLGEAEQWAEAAAARLAELPEVDDDALAELERLYQDEQGLEAGLEAASPRLELTARRAIRLQVVGAGGAAGREGGGEGDADGGDESGGEREGGDGRKSGERRENGEGKVGDDGAIGGVVELAAGEAWRRRPAARLQVEVPGVLAITVAPGGDAVELHRRLGEAREASARRCRELGVESLDAARDAHRLRRAAASEAQAAQAVLASLGGADGDELERRRAALLDEVESLGAEIATLPVAAGRGVSEGQGGETAAEGMPVGETEAAEDVAAGRDTAEAEAGTAEAEPGGEATRWTPAAALAAVAEARDALVAAERAAEAARRQVEPRRRDHEAAAGTLRELVIELRNAEDRRRRGGERAGALLRRRREAGGAGAAAGGSSGGEEPAAASDALSAAGDPGQLALFAAARDAAATRDTVATREAVAGHQGAGPAAAPGADGAAAPLAEEPAAGAAVPPAVDPLPAAVAEAERRVTAVGDELAAAQRGLAEARPEVVRRAAADREAELAALRGEQRRAEDEHLAVRTRLETAGDQALFERLEDSRARCAAARRAAASVEARAAAAARLRDAVDAARDAARRTYSEPLARTVADLGRPLFGDDFSVELDDDLNVARRTAFGATLEYARLSTGAQEQLALLVRLACAVLVSPAEGVPLIVDDALGYSDETRLRALGEVLSRVGERCQVLILTCFPDRYGHVAGARRIRLGNRSEGEAE